MKHNICILQHACSATVRLLDSWAVTHPILGKPRGSTTHWRHDTFYLRRVALSSSSRSQYSFIVSSNDVVWKRCLFHMCDVTHTHTHTPNNTYSTHIHSLLWGAMDRLRVLRTNVLSSNAFPAAPGLWGFSLKSAYRCVCIHIYVGISLCIHVFLFVCIYIHIYTYIYMYMYIYIYI